MTLPTPTIERARAACDEFDHENQLMEDALGQLRCQFPRNMDISHVLVKVVTLNELYHTRINDKDIEATARHICELDIDELLGQGRYKAVDLISNVPTCEDAIRLPPSFVAGTIPKLSRSTTDTLINVSGFIKKQADHTTQFPFANFLRQDLLQYERFVEVVIAFRNHFKLDSLTFKELDKFLWCTGSKIVKS